MSLFLGIDSGTQSVKAVVYDATAKKIVAEGKAPHSLISGLPSGHMEQHPEEWAKAMDDAILSALANIDKSAVKAIGVSGQQHGFVPLDGEGKVIRPAKLWCDTSTMEECSLIADALGGQMAAIDKIGNRILPGFTAPKILWLKRNEPEKFARLRHVLLPHDYLNFYLTGEYFMEYGDASGTAMMDVKSRGWSLEVINAIDPCVVEYLPDLSSSDSPCGCLRKEIAEKYGLSEQVLVSSGGGDNMMGAIGTGNVRSGVATASFGTSGTIYAYNDKPVIDSNGEIAAFCDSTNGYLPLLCTMNVTTVSEQFRKLFSMDHEALNTALNSVEPGCDGLFMLPYLEGERTPSLPTASGVFFGLNQKTISPEHMLRAAVEGVTMGMNFGLRRLRELGVKTNEVRLTGGGSRSEAWRRIIADAFGTSVVCMAEDEGAALGGALQAEWCFRKQSDSSLEIASVVEGATQLDESTRLEANAESHAKYQEMQTFFDKLTRSMQPIFDEHVAFKS
ncbi:xylulokinase [Puniceicoccaceae bacterium K14]|nr:xylulokinase [Puniceicoccaceae bacterium K14]